MSKILPVSKEEIIQQYPELIDCYIAKIRAFLSTLSKFVDNEKTLTIEEKYASEPVFIKYMEWIKTTCVRLNSLIMLKYYLKSEAGTNLEILMKEIEVWEQERDKIFPQVPEQKALSDEPIEPSWFVEEDLVGQGSYADNV